MPLPVLMVRLLFPVMLLSASATFAEATTYYVNKAGSDRNSCAAAQSDGGSAKLTIAAGIACLSGGDTLSIGDGTYKEVIARNSIPSGRGTYGEAPGDHWPNATVITATNVPKKRICSAAELGDLAARIGGCATPTVVIQSPASCSNGGFGYLVLMDKRDYIIWQGITLDGNDTCGGIYSVSGNGGVQDSTAKRHRFYRSEVKNAKGCSTGCGMIALSDNKDGNNDGQVSHHEFVESWAHDFAVGPNANVDLGGFMHCFYDFSDHFYMYRSVVSDCRGSAVTNHNGTSNALIKENIIYNAVGGAAIRLSRSNNTAVGNIIFDTSSYADCDWIDGGTPRRCPGSAATFSPITIHLSRPNGNKVYNNTIYRSNNEQACISVINATDTEVTDNICYGGVSDAILVYGSTGTTTENNRCANGCSEAAEDPFRR